MRHFFIEGVCDRLTDEGEWLIVFYAEAGEQVVVEDDLSGLIDLFANTLINALIYDKKIASERPAHCAFRPIK